MKVFDGDAGDMGYGDDLDSKGFALKR